MFGGIAKNLVEALVGALAGRVLTMLKVEVEHAKAEVQEKAQGLATGLAVLAVGAVFAFFAVGVLLVAAVVGLSYLVPLWAAALIVGGALALISLILSLAGKAKVDKNKNLMPDKAIANIKGLLGR